MLFPSPRFSPVAAIELIKKTGAKTMLLPKPYPPVALSILHEHPMISFEVPDLDELLDTQYPPYPYERTFEQARNEPLVTLHTSGSTGFPKPIIWTHGWAASFAEELYLAPPSGYESTTALILGRRIFQLFPAFHVRTPEILL
jgi:acyl-coenzyme A synthetase/AMP-(fatty) acid ligase